MSDKSLFRKVTEGFPEPELLELGFKKNEWTDEGEKFTEYLIGNSELGVLISGVNLVEITQGKSVFITVQNCKDISDLKTLINLFGL